MSQSDIVNRVAAKLANGRPDANGAYTAVCSAISEILDETGSIRIKGLGTLKVVDTKPRTARNPKTGAAIDVPAGRKVRFVASKSLKDVVA